MYPNTVKLVVTLIKGLGHNDITVVPAMLSRGTWLIEDDENTIVVHLAGYPNSKGQIRSTDEIEFDTPIQK